MITLICECCGFVQDFNDGEDAFAKGWDAPPHFTNSPITCTFCPSSLIILGKTELHDTVHERWAKEGRPSV